MNIYYNTYTLTSSGFMVTGIIDVLSELDTVVVSKWEKTTLHKMSSYNTAIIIIINNILRLNILLVSVLLQSICLWLTLLIIERCTVTLYFFNIKLFPNNKISSNVQHGKWSQNIFDWTFLKCMINYNIKIIIPICMLFSHGRLSVQFIVCE